jgi:hypothetical protein
MSAHYKNYTNISLRFSGLLQSIVASLVCDDLVNSLPFRDGCETSDRSDDSCHSDNCETLHLLVRSQFLTSASMKMTVFWDVAPRSLVEIYWHFRGTYCPHHQGDEAVSTSEISVNFYQTTRLNIPEDSHLHFTLRTTGVCLTLRH